MDYTISEILQFRWLLKEVGIGLDTATPILCDNQAAQHIANNLVFRERTKHVEIDCFFVRVRSKPKEIMPMLLTACCRFQIYSQKLLAHPDFSSFLARWTLRISMIHLEGEYQKQYHINISFISLSFIHFSLSFYLSYVFTMFIISCIPI